MSDELEEWEQIKAAVQRCGGRETEFMREAILGRAVERLEGWLMGIMAERKEGEK